jgi:hypothetical protein
MGTQYVAVLSMATLFTFSDFKYSPSDRIETVVVENSFTAE